jgi:hypothetical protein
LQPPDRRHSGTPPPHAEEEEPPPQHAVRGPVLPALGGASPAGPVAATEDFATASATPIWTGASGRSPSQTGTSAPPKPSLSPSRQTSSGGPTSTRGQDESACAGTPASGSPDKPSRSPRAKPPGHAFASTSTHTSGTEGSAAFARLMSKPGTVRSSNRASRRPTGGSYSPTSLPYSRQPSMTSGSPRTRAALRRSSPRAL